MEELITYIGSGLEDDKSGEKSIGYSVSSHSNTISHAYKSANAHPNGVVSTGPGDEDKLFVAVKNKALIHVYIHGKEAPIQKIPVPEQLSALALTNCSVDDNQFELPWLLIGGSITGKLYIWEISSGDLLFNKSVHYQKITKIMLSKNNNFLITSSEDSRVLIFKLLEIINSQSNNIKPFHTITDHTLPITDFIVTNGINSDLKLITASLDSTCKVYDLSSMKLIFSLISTNPVNSICMDPAFRTLYFGLNNGTVRQVKLYEFDSFNKLYHIAEKSKIITLEDDLELNKSFIVHQQQEGAENQDIKITFLTVSFDGTLLISGDSLGKVLISDIVTKQNVKTLKAVNGEVSFIQNQIVLQNNSHDGKDSNILGIKKSANFRKIPNLQRALNIDDITNHEISFKIPETEEDQEEDFDFNKHLVQVSFNEKYFKSNQNKSFTTTNNDDELQKKYQKLQADYDKLKTAHSNLFEEHIKVIN